MKIIQMQVVTQPTGPDWHAFQEMYALREDGAIMLLHSPGCRDRSLIESSLREWRILSEANCDLPNPEGSIGGTEAAVTSQPPSSAAQVHPVVGQG